MRVKWLHTEISWHIDCNYSVCIIDELQFMEYEIEYTEKKGNNDGLFSFASVLLKESVWHQWPSFIGTGMDNFIRYTVVFCWHALHSFNFLHSAWCVKKKGIKPKSIRKRKLKKKPLIPYFSNQQLATEKMIQL